MNKYLEKQLEILKQEQDKGIFLSPHQIALKYVNLSILEHTGMKPAGTDINTIKTFEGLKRDIEKLVSGQD